MRNCYDKGYYMASWSFSGYCYCEMNPMGDFCDVIGAEDYENWVYAEDGGNNADESPNTEFELVDFMDDCMPMNNGNEVAQAVDWFED